MASSAKFSPEKITPMARITDSAMTHRFEVKQARLAYISLKTTLLRGMHSME